MSFFSLLSTLLIGPLKLIFEIIYVIANRFIGHPGLSIIVLSLIMNILVLPLYKRADAMQEASRDIEAKLHDGVAHIKKTFTGDERMMILQTYYRQNNYKPTDALNGSVSLLLEVPFFMAAYQFLSNLKMLQGVSLGPIADLSAPDAMFIIGGLTINVLPVIMTLVNVISSTLYLKGSPAKTKIQLYAMALFFLVFLYNSPSGLVFYWTLNNVFSLVKTVFYKLKNPRNVLSVLASAAGLLALAAGIFVYSGDSVKLRILLVGIGILMQFPLVSPILSTKVHRHNKNSQLQPNRKLFILGSLFLTILVGLLIPSTYIAASPQEFVDITYFHNPMWYVVNTLCLSAGTFLVWMGVFYWLASPRGKVIFDKLVWVLCGIMLVNYMFFGTDLGVISSNLKYESGFGFSGREQLVNFLIMAVIAVVLYFIVGKWHRAAATVLLTAIIALGGMSVVNMVTINKSVDNLVLYPNGQSDDRPHFQLSKTGKNVVVIMLDRAMNEYVPYIFNEKPELEEQFAGFTRYANTISFGGYTNFGVPSLVGGYEYTPVEMNKRSTESLASKHNESLKVMPVLFMENGFDVTVCDPPYANYQWIPDLTIFDEYPEIHTYITEGKFSDDRQKEIAIEHNYRNFFCFGIMKCMPLFVQPTLYGDGNYNRAETLAEADYTSTQTVQSMSVAEGMDVDFMGPYEAIANLSLMTNVTGEEIDTFMFLSNSMTHEPMLLQAPEYVPAQNVDNSIYDETHTDRFVVDSRILHVDNDNQMSHYHANMAAFIQLGKWFDYLRENDVYDNTRIILVSDHGRILGHHEELFMGEDNWQDAESYYPLLMVKDFDSESFETSYEFMTNADVPTMAMNGLIENPRNPFTGKIINNDEKAAHEQYIIASNDWNVEVNNGNTFLPSRWCSVKDDLWDKDNWTFYDDEVVLTEHAAP